MALPNKLYWKDRMDERFRYVEGVENQMFNRYTDLFKQTTDDYIKLLKPFTNSSGEVDFIKLNDALLYNPKFSRTVGRYQGLIEAYERKILELATDETLLIERALTTIYAENYYNLAYEISKQAGHELVFNQLNSDALKRTIHTAWAEDGKEFSNRIWQNKLLLTSNFREIMENSIASGENPINTIRKLQNATGNSFYNSKRILRTETTAVITESDADLYKQLGFNQYEYDATFDSRTSEICGNMDKQRFYFSEMKLGTNAPPLHPHCRSTIEAVDITEYELSQRYARDANNKPIRIPSNLTYKEYKERYLNKK